MNKLLGDLSRDAELALSRGRLEARRFATRMTELRRRFPAATPVAAAFAFGQFYVGAHALHSAVVEREFSEAGDWVAWSLSDQIVDDQIQHPEIDRLYRFELIPTLRRWNGFAPVVTMWLSAFYYYARRLAAMRDLGEALWPFSVSWLSRSTDTNLTFEVAELGTMLLGWASQENETLARELTPFIVALAAADEVTVPRVKLAAALATRSGRFSELSPESWAMRALAAPREMLTVHERLQVLTTVVSHRYDDKMFDEALHLVDEIQSQMTSSSEPKVAERCSLDAMPELAMSLACCALVRRDAKHLLSVLERWYCIDTAAGHIDVADLAVTVPFHLDGFLFIANGRHVHVPGDRQALLEALTRTENEFVGTSLTVIGAANDALHVPERFGVPDEAHGAAFEAVLTEVYCPAELIAVRDQLPSERTVQLVVAAKPHPIQTVQLRALGRTWPIAVSLQRAQPDRPIRRVAIWSGAGSMTEGMEVEAVKAVFELAEVTVEVHAPAQTTVADFQRVYCDPAIDALWVVSHGEYDHWAPKNVAIQIGASGNFVAIDDLVGLAPRGDARRLLMLNVCDGGRFEGVGVLPRLGFGLALASARQAVISHLWPVRGYAAAAFGTLVAAQLARGVSYFDAFVLAMDSIRGPKDQLSQAIADVIGGPSELAERIFKGVENFESFASSGSAVFYQ